MKKHLIKTVLATLLSFVLAGSALFSNAVFAASDPELVKVPGDTLDLTNRTYDVLDLTHPDIEKYVTSTKELFSSSKKVTVQPNSSANVVFNVPETGLYYFGVNCDFSWRMDTELFEYSSQIKDSRMTFIETIKLGRKSTTLFNDYDHSITINVTLIKAAQADLYGTYQYRTRLTSGNVDYLDYTFTAPEAGTYYFGYKFYTDSSYTTEDITAITMGLRMPMGVKLYDGDIEKERNKYMVYLEKDQSIHISGQLSYAKYFEMTFHKEVEMTDISGYSEIRNDDMYWYEYVTDDKRNNYYCDALTTPEGTIFVWLPNYGGSWTRCDNYEVKSSIRKIFPSVDINGYSTVKDSFEEITEMKYYFAPTESKDYYFDSSDLKLQIEAFDGTTQDITPRTPISLKKDVEYIISATPSGNNTIGSFDILEKKASSPTTPTNPTNPSEPSTSTGLSFADFVERLYVVALNRPSEPEGKAFWCEHVGNGDLNGAQCANEFLLSKEFNDRKLSNEEFLTVLYKTFFDRDAAADPDGFNFWMNSLKTEGRDKVVDGFINSTEWCNICASYGVKSGATRAKATIASKNATDFATRLYTCCLGRDAESDGLKFWSLGLTNLEVSGYEAAKQFFESAEFNGFKTSDEEYLRRLYTTFMGREADTDGLNYWLNVMKGGMSREQVLIEFAKSKEFSEICNTYAINRGI